jgi:hypothetical protein
MARLFIFADEAGDFVFARGNNISRYFIVCSVRMDSCEVAHSLLDLRRRLVWLKQPVNDYFHASEDKQAIRDLVFASIAPHDFSIQATILEKSKAGPAISSSAPQFYQHAWLYHFTYAIAEFITDTDELVITAASVQTKKAQAVFTNAVNNVIQQHLPRERWATSFAPCSHDPCLQVADYCTWAIQRKWERGDSRSYDLVKYRISYERDLWQHDSRHHY